MYSSFFRLLEQAPIFSALIFIIKLTPIIQIRNMPFEYAFSLLILLSNSTFYPYDFYIL